MDDFMRRLVERSMTRREFGRVTGIGLGVLGLAACSPSSRAYGDDGLPLDGPYEVSPEHGVMVAMRDGVRLATDVYHPARDGERLAGPWPVILERTPYGKNRPSRSERSLADPDEAKSRAEVAEIFVRRGYVVIYQDCRGRYDSEGAYQKYLDDAADGYDTCAWILEQPWCDGQIGTKGLSYAAHTQAAKSAGRSASVSSASL